MYKLNYSDGTYDMAIATNVSAIYIRFPAIKNHIYYIRSTADGVLCNGVQFGAAVQEKDSSYVPTIIYGEWTVNPRIDTSYRNEQVFSICCKIDNPRDPNFEPSNVELALYANKNDSTAKRSIIRYGWPLIVDLTDSFGENNEPSKDWCDRNMWVLASENGVKTNILVVDEEGKYESVDGIFDDEGNCILDLPGFDTWNICSMDTSGRYILSFDSIVVDAVKKYYIDTSSSDLKYCQYRVVNDTTELLQEITARYNFVGDLASTFDLFKLENNNQIRIRSNIIDPGKTDIYYYIYEKLPNDDGTFNYLDYKDTQSPVRSGNTVFDTNFNIYHTERYAKLDNVQNYVIFINIVGDYTESGIRKYWDIVEP